MSKLKAKGGLQLIRLRLQGVFDIEAFVQSNLSNLHVRNLESLHATHFRHTALYAEGVVAVEALPDIQPPVKQDVPCVVNLEMARV